DISWDEVAKYILSSPQATKNSAEVLEKFPDRFLFGTDVVAPPTQEFYLGVYNMYHPLFDILSNDTKEKLLLKNYERLFDKARLDVRAWEKENVLKK
ncbi:MAG TPA: amidohydrolase, partial [Chitinophagales bacterium]|nr:amidohydrolase [Chitinophagales bacterium]